MKDRMRGGSFLLYYLRVGRCARSGGIPGYSWDGNDAQSGAPPSCRIINFMSER